MELIRSIQNALQFISAVQECCDKHRKCMEHLWLEEYDIYINKWKQNQIEQRNHTEIKNFENNHLKGEDFEELEELVLADSLLRKARNIRLKNQKTVNGMIVSDSGSVDVSEKVKLKKRFPQSKSDYAISRGQSSIVPRSKSASGTLVPKEICKGRKYSLKSPEKRFDDRAVVSSKDLDALKRLQISLSTCHPLKPPKSSDASENCEVCPHPSSREFLNGVKGKLNAVSSHFKLKVWYPFLSYKSEVFLTSVDCKTLGSIKRTSTILYIIQETLLWIDLLYLMESDIYPNVIWDRKDAQKLRVCSYLLGLFHQNGQRTPMLDPNG